MGNESPFLNPLWPDAVWDVSGAFADDLELFSFYDFCKNNLNLEPFHIVHGAPMCAWNSGRVLPHMMRSIQEVNVAVAEYKKRNIAIYLTFTNTLLEERHLKDPIGNTLCRLCSGNNPTGRNSIILANDLLKKYIRKEYPYLKVISSILKITADKGKGNLDAYKRLADEYDEVMVHPDDTLNYKLLEKLEDKDRYILLVNEYCIRNCPLRANHYEALSRMSLEFLNYDPSAFVAKQQLNGCQQPFLMLTLDKKNVLALNTPYINRLCNMCFRHFKLQGRGGLNAGPLMSDLLRLVLRSDEEDENMMHVLGQRFWESTAHIE